MQTLDCGSSEFVLVNAKTSNWQCMSVLIGESFITLHASCGTVYCNRSCLCVCVCVSVFMGLLPR